MLVSVTCGGNEGYLYRLLFHDGGDDGRCAEVFLDLVLDHELALLEELEFLFLHFGPQPLVLNEDLAFQHAGWRQRHSRLQLFSIAVSHKGT